jgi:hypothetical protein
MYISSKISFNWHLNLIEGCATQSWCVLSVIMFDIYLILAAGQWFFFNINLFGFDKELLFSKMNIYLE